MDEIVVRRLIRLAWSPRSSVREGFGEQSENGFMIMEGVDSEEVADL
jgi:hypothetical protein